LRNAFDDLANKSVRGSRNDTMNKLALKMGRLAANGWVDGGLVVRVLLLGAGSCGLLREDGEAQCRATILSGLRAGMKYPYPPLTPFGDQNTIQPKHAPNMAVPYTVAEIENRSKGE
jgi:hypothetical protein